MTETTPENPASSIADSTSQLLDELAELTLDREEPATPEQLVQLAHKAKAVLADMDAKTRQARTYEEIIKIIPDYTKLRNRLWQICYRSLDRVEIKQLDMADQDLLMEAMGEVHHFRLVKNRNGNAQSNHFYVFGWPPVVFETPQWKKLRDVAVDSEQSLTAAQERIIEEAEENVFKLHLQVLPEQKKAVLKALMAADKRDNARSMRIFQEKDERGETGGITMEMMATEGYEAAHISHWKMKAIDKNDQTEFADFVFYAAKEQGGKEWDWTQKMIEEVHRVLVKEGVILTGDVATPRYSMPVVSEKWGALPGFYIVQGDGDWKDYLRRMGKLDELWDATTNYATRKGFQGRVQ